MSDGMRDEVHDEEQHGTGPAPLDGEPGVIPTPLEAFRTTDDAALHMAARMLPLTKVRVPANDENRSVMETLVRQGLATVERGELFTLTVRGLSHAIQSSWR